MLNIDECDADFFIECNKYVRLGNIPQDATAIFRKIWYDYHIFARLSNEQCFNL